MDPIQSYETEMSVAADDQNRLKRKPTIAIVLAIDSKDSKPTRTTNNKYHALSIDALESRETNSNEIKKNIGKELIHELLKNGHVHRKPDYYYSDENVSEQRKQMDSKYDELIAALNSILAHAQNNNGNGAGLMLNKPGKYYSSGDNSCESDEDFPDIDDDVQITTTIPTTISTTPMHKKIAAKQQFDNSQEIKLYNAIKYMQKQLKQMIDFECTCQRMLARDKAKSSKCRVKKHPQFMINEDYENLILEMLKRVKSARNDDGALDKENKSEQFETPQKFSLPINILASTEKNQFSNDDDPFEIADIDSDYSELTSHEMLDLEQYPLATVSKRDESPKTEVNDNALHTFQNHQPKQSAERTKTQENHPRKRENHSESILPEFVKINHGNIARKHRTVESSTSVGNLQKENNLDSTTDSSNLDDSNSSTVYNESVFDDGNYSIEADESPEGNLLSVKNNYGLEFEKFANKKFDKINATNTDQENNISKEFELLTSTELQTAHQIIDEFVDEKTVMAKKNNLRIPLRLLKDKHGEIQLVLNGRFVCSNCKRKQRKPKPKPPTPECH